MASRWSCNAPEKTCYELREFFKKEEMCPKCSNFLERVNGIKQKPRKGTSPKCERIKLMNKTSKSTTAKALTKQWFEDIISQ